MNTPDRDRLSFEDCLGLLVDREITARENRQLTARLKKAKLRQSACVEDVDFRHRRGLDQALFLQLSQCSWIKEHHNVIIIGPTGVGKTYLACALALAKGDGRCSSLLKSMARADLIVLDDWGLKGFSIDQQHDLLEILEDRHGLRSTLITNSTVADAICDRLVHNAYRITLKGESMRKLKYRLT